MLARYRSALQVIERNPSRERDRNGGDIVPKELNASSGMASIAVSSSQNSKNIDSSRMLLSRI